jgi:hypothetical protein
MSIILIFTIIIETNIKDENLTLDWKQKNDKHKDLQKRKRSPYRSMR